MRRFFSFIFILVILAACNRTEYNVKGRLLYKDIPLQDAEVAVYLKLEKDKDTPPLKVVATNERGEFEVKLKKGSYFLTGKKRLDEGGEVNMLVGTYSETPIVVTKDLILNDWTLHSKKEREELKRGIGIRGVVKDFLDYRRVRVYAYGDTKSGLKGPDYIAQAKIAKDGTFKMDLREGNFFISIRERKGSFVGPLREGDRTLDYPGNPIKIAKDGYLDIGVLSLKNVDNKKLEDLRRAGYLKEGVGEIRGVVIDEKGTPVKNIYVLAYKDPEMVGRPVTISLPSHSDGSFTLKVPKEGKYYIGARSKIGGPAEPGEKIGSIKGTIDKSIYIKGGEVKNIRIEVREIW